MDRQAGRLERTLEGRRAALLGPTPHRPGGPPIWVAGAVAAARERTGRLYDGWFPNSPSVEEYPVQWAEVQAAARAAGRDPAALTGAMYLTLAIDDDAARADARLNAYLEQYYGMPPDVTRKRQMSLRRSRRRRGRLAEILCRRRRQPSGAALRRRPRAAARNRSADAPEAGMVAAWLSGRAE